MIRRPTGLLPRSRRLISPAIHAKEGRRSGALYGRRWAPAPLLSHDVEVMDRMVATLETLEPY